MKLRGKITKKAYKLIKLRFYSSARNILVKYINGDSGSKDILGEAYGLLSLIDLIQKDLRKAEHHVSRSLLINRSNTVALMSKAYVYIAEQNYEEALRTYFMVLAIEPGNNLAKTNIDRIKNISKLKKRPSARKFLIRSRFPTAVKYSMVVGTLVSIAIMSYLSVNVFYPMIELRFFNLEQRQLRERLNNFYLFDGLENVEAENTQSITYSPKQIDDMFTLAKSNMIKGDINSAVVIINTAFNSDINVYLKEQFERLSSFIVTPNYNALKNNISYTDLIETPSLYIGGFVKWVVNLDSFEKVRNEDGYDEILARVIVFSGNGDTSEGLATVIFKADAQLTKNERLEIYARIESFNSARKIPTLRNIVVKHLPPKQ